MRGAFVPLFAVALTLQACGGKAGLESIALQPGDLPVGATTCPQSGTLDHFIAGMSPGTERDGWADLWKQLQGFGATEAVVVLYGPPDFCTAGTIVGRSDDIQVSNLVIRCKDAAAAVAAFKGRVAEIRSHGGREPIPPQLGSFQTLGAATGLGENSYTDINTDPRMSDPTIAKILVAGGSVAYAQWQKGDLVATLQTVVKPKMSADAIKKAAQAIYSRMP